MASSNTLASDLPLEQLYRLLQPFTIPPSSPKAKFSNWAQTFACTPLAVFEPRTTYECQLIIELARREQKGVRAVGVGHSPSDLACTDEYMLITTSMNEVLEINKEKNYIVAEGGIILDDLHIKLAEHGLAMINVGSISDQTLAGIVTTASHGTGITYSVMSCQVLAVTLLLANGEVVSCSRSDRSDLFFATICGLGSTGLILDVKLEVEPAFNLKEVQESVAFQDVVGNLATIVPAAEHVRLWWFPAADAIRINSFNRTQEPINAAYSWLWDSFFGFHVLQLLLFLGRFITSLNIWTGRLAGWLASGKSTGINVSHRIFNLDCRYPHHTTEWAIPYEKAEPCLRELRDLIWKEFNNPNGLRPHFPVEIRFSAADDIWLSPSTGYTTCWIGFVQYKPYGYNVPYRKLFDGYEAIIARYQGRPHWAKAHRLRPAELRSLYPRFDDFVSVLEQVDPDGIFRNQYVRRHIFGDARESDRVFRSTPRLKK